MAEYIEREAVKRGMIRYGFAAPDMTVTEFVEDELPAADVAGVRHGRWVKREHGNGEYGFPDGRVLFHCSLCDWARLHNNDNYCPNCGAKMDGGDE